MPIKTYQGVFEELGDRIAEALGLDPTLVSKITVICEAGILPEITVEMVAVEELGVDWNAELAGAQEVGDE